MFYFKGVLEEHLCTVWIKGFSFGRGSSVGIPQCFFWSMGFMFGFLDLKKNALQFLI